MELLRPVFSCFHGQHFWHRMKLKNIFFFLKKLKKKLGSDTFSIVSCSIRDPSPRDFSLMTLTVSNSNYSIGIYVVIYIDGCLLLDRKID